jgi:hypothetical protein
MSLLEPPRWILADGDVARKVLSSRYIANSLSEHHERHRRRFSVLSSYGRVTHFFNPKFRRLASLHCFIEVFSGSGRVGDKPTGAKKMR